MNITIFAPMKNFEVAYLKEVFEGQMQVKYFPVQLEEMGARFLFYTSDKFDTSLFQMDDIELINVNFALSPSLISGQVDAVVGAFRNFELNQMEISGHPGHAFYVEEEGVPAYDELVLVANAAKLGDDRLPRFVRALEAGVQYLVNHPQASWDLFIEGRPELDDELNRRAWKDTLTRFALRPGAVDSGRYARFAEFLVAQGLIPRALAVEDYAVELR